MKMLLGIVSSVLWMAVGAQAGESQDGAGVRPHFQVGSVYSITGTFHCEGSGGAKTQRGSGSASGTLDANFEIQVEVRNVDGAGRPQRTLITVVEYRRLVHPLYVNKEDRLRERWQKQQKRRTTASPYEGRTLLCEPHGDGIDVYDVTTVKGKPKRVKRVDGDLWRLIDEVLYATWTWEAPTAIEKGDTWSFDPAHLLRLGGVRIPAKPRKEEDHWHGTGRATVDWVTKGQAACVSFDMDLESCWETNDMVCEATGHTTVDPATGLMEKLVLQGDVAFRTTKRSGMSASGFFKLELEMKTLTHAPITGGRAADVDGIIAARIAALGHENDAAARDAAASLANFGARARAAAPALTQALGHASAGVRRAAAHALGRIGEAEAVDALAKALKDEDEDVRIAAVRALGEMDASAAKPLAATLQGKEVTLQRAAAEALGELGPAAKGAVKALARIVKDKRADLGVRGTAAQALGEIGSAAKGARKALKDAIRNGVPEARDALKRIRSR